MVIIEACVREAFLRSVESLTPNPLSLETLVHWWPNSVNFNLCFSECNIFSTSRINGMKKFTLVAHCLSTIPLESIGFPVLSFPLMADPTCAMQSLLVSTSLPHFPLHKLHSLSEFVFFTPGIVP